MSDPITPRGFEPRSLKNSLGRRSTVPPARTPPGQASPGQSPADIDRPGAATTAQDSVEPTSDVVAQRDAGESAPLPASAAQADRAPAKQQPRSRASKTGHGAQHERAPRSAGTGKPADARTRPRAPRGQIVFYLPVELSRQLRSAAHQQSKTHADVIFDAIESRLDDLDALLHEAESTPPAAGVFTRSDAKPAEPKVQVSGQIRADNLKVIDRLVEQHGADSRSQLVEVALRAHLDDVDASSR